jgi:hypothetical protein
MPAQFSGLCKPNAFVGSAHMCIAIGSASNRLTVMSDEGRLRLLQAPIQMEVSMRNRRQDLSQQLRYSTYPIRRWRVVCCARTATKSFFSVIDLSKTCLPIQHPTEFHIIRPRRTQLTAARIARNSNMPCTPIEL